MTCILIHFSQGILLGRRFASQIAQSALAWNWLGSPRHSTSRLSFLFFAFFSSNDFLTHIDTYKELLREAKQAKDQAAIDAAKKEITRYNEAQKTRPKASGDYTEKFEVPSGGTTEANFELPE